jgi:bifunctional non-homologous end joining protein LigD
MVSASPKKIRKLRFVLQEHFASHHHFDFRLEQNGVLKSWALPKGMPSRIGDKKLAVAVEDHPLRYINFTGIIPKGQYGAGKVLIADYGYYYLLKSSSNDHINFILEGGKFKGKYALIKLQKASWLITKVNLREAKAN